MTTLTLAEQLLQHLNQKVPILSTNKYRATVHRYEDYTTIKIRVNLDAIVPVERRAELV